MIRSALTVVVCLLVTSAARADFNPLLDQVIAASPQLYNFDGTPVDGDSVHPNDPTGTTYSVYTGLATAAGALSVVEPSAPPVRDDVVPFDGLADPINNYLTGIGTLVGQQRSVIETATPLGGGAYQIVITVSSTLAAGGPGDLWPAGITSGGNALTGGGFGIGLNLGAALGNDPLDWQPSPTVVNSGSIRISTGGVFAAPVNLPLTFFAPSAANWNGVLAVSLGNGATGTGIQDAIELTLLVNKTPEPATLSLLAVGGLMLLRRRAR